MDKKKIFVGFVAATLFSTVLMSLPNSAGADQNRRYDRSDKHRDRDRRSDWGELRRQRSELRRDLAELERDRADLRQLYRNGANRSAIDRKKAEIRRDLREVRGSQHEIRENYADIRGDRYHYNRSYNSPWWRWGSGWWRDR